MENLVEHVPNGPCSIRLSKVETRKIAALVSPMKQYSFYDKRTKKSYHKARFYTYTNPLFNLYRESFYPNGKDPLGYY